MIAWLVALLLALPTAWLLLQTIAAAMASRTPPNLPPSMTRGPVAVLVPAHDEEAGLAATLRTIVPELRPGDRLLVVADNCSDDTARVAREEGADVVERDDPVRRGKGYALDAGIRALEASPPATVLIVDADCTLHPGSLDRLAASCTATQRPAQALDLMHAAPGSGLRARFAAFAWAVKNEARPLGALRLGLPCQLMGTGMAFPWPLIRDAKLASAEIVEDMQLGMDLAAAGHAPLFCPQARVDSWFPADADSTRAQRARWERGHLALIVRRAVPAFAAGVARGQPALAALALDLAVPPLTVLAFLLATQVVADAVLVAALGSVGVGALVLAAVTMAAFATAVGLAWHRVGRSILTGRELAGAPLYMLAKLPMYASFLRRGKPAWVRARRDLRAPPEPGDE